MSRNLRRPERVVEVAQALLSIIDIKKASPRIESHPLHPPRGSRKCIRSARFSETSTFRSGPLTSASQHERTEIADGGRRRQQPPCPGRDFAIGPAAADLEEMV
jgi:hypothetical protein